MSSAQCHNTSCKHPQYDHHPYGCRGKNADGSDCICKRYEPYWSFLISSTKEIKATERSKFHKNIYINICYAFRIHYNFIREHGSIKKTPAEQAGIKLDLGQNKIETLIKLASQTKN